jgi:hypothetical protein
LEDEYAGWKDKVIPKSLGLLIYQNLLAKISPIIKKLVKHSENKIHAKETSKNFAKNICNFLLNKFLRILLQRLC